MLSLTLMNYGLSALLCGQSQVAERVLWRVLGLDNSMVARQSIVKSRSLSPVSPWEHGRFHRTLAFPKYSSRSDYCPLACELIAQVNATVCLAHQTGLGAAYVRRVPVPELGAGPAWAQVARAALSAAVAVAGFFR